MIFYLSQTECLVTFNRGGAYSQHMYASGSEVPCGQPNYLTKTNYELVGYSYEFYYNTIHWYKDEMYTPGQLDDSRSFTINLWVTSEKLFPSILITNGACVLYGHDSQWSRTYRQHNDRCYSSINKPHPPNLQPFW